MNRLIAFFCGLSIVIAVTALIYAFVIFTGLLFGSLARGQDAPPRMIGVEVVYDAPPTNTSFIERRAAQPMIPPLPPLPLHPTKLLATFTNDNGEVIEFRLRKPAPLQMPRKSWTNAFWVACPECDGEAIRKPMRIEKMGTKTVEDGDEHEYFIYFRCCGQEFKSRYLRRVTTPIAVPVAVPVR